MSRDGKDALFAVILAGGSGARFWPRSRGHRPKQLLDIVGPESMIRQTIARVLPLVDPARIFVVTNEAHRGETGRHLREVPPSNILTEPVGRNTAPAVGYAAVTVSRIRSDAVMLVLPADHLVADEEKFRTALLKAARYAAKSGDLVTLGVRPTGPETGYGYIRAGRSIGGGLRAVSAFVEKPDRGRAARYVASGRYFWNSGMFAWRADAVLREIRTHLPALAGGLDEIASKPKRSRRAAVRRVYPTLPAVSIDVGVLEKSDRVACLPVSFRWDDVGSWTALDRILARGESGNVAHGTHVSIDTKDTLVYSPRKLVATVGVRDLIVVETEDALLVCHKSRAQDVRQVVEQLKARRMTEYL